MDTLRDMKHFCDVAMQYREAIRKWVNEPFPTDAISKEIRTLRTELQRGYARLEEGIAKYSGMNMAKNSAFGVKQDVFEVAFDRFDFFNVADKLHSIDQAIRILNRAIGKLEAEGDTWVPKVRSPERSEWTQAEERPESLTRLPRPILKTPQYHDDNVEPIPTFTWDPVEGAIAYEFVLAEDLGQVDHFALIDYIAATSVPAHMSIEELKYGTIYHWRVRAVSKNARSLWTASSFTTVNELPVRSLKNRASFAQATTVLRAPEFKQPRGQFEKAVQLFTQNPPDNENALKDAVAAVEGVANVIAGTSGQQLNTVIDRLVAGNKIPKPSDEIFKKLYARRGAAPGVAHSNVTEATALTDVEVSFLLGVCAECIQYLAQLR